ncbi:MAG: hypothetical protein GSR84_00790, partial [Desulfurococcales archaeon]|nr:hypothetical protein [Desulfurococcales archaeon]
VRSSSPEVVAEDLSRAGFEVEVLGVSVEVAVDGPGGAGRLFRALSALASRGVTIYSVDLVEPGLEEVLSGGS